MAFREIKPLINEDSGEHSVLCPVLALKTYIEHTKNIQTGQLFISPNNKEKQLTVQQLGAHVRALIKLADPTSKVKVHEVRRIAASHSFAESMVVGDLVSTFQWSSPAVFYRHYFTQPETLSKPVVFPSRNTP